MKPSHLTFLMLLFTPAGSKALTADFYVAPHGDDSGTGTMASPFATLSRARDASRGVRGESVSIYLRQGTYYLREAVVFTAQDARTAEAPLLIRPVPGEQVTLSGGRRLDLRWQPYRDGIQQARVPPGLTFDQLFVNAQRQHMARFPNYDPRAQYFQGFSSEATSPERVKGWSDPSGGFVHAMHRSLWGDMHWRITGKTDDGKLELVGGWQNNRQMGAHAEYRFVEHIFEELDAPGEWYLDVERDMLYLYPPAGVDLGAATIEAVCLTHLIELRGNRQHPVRYLTLQGLTLTQTARSFMENKEPLLRSDWTTYRGGAVLSEGSEDCTIRDCHFDQVGGNAVFLSRYNRRIQIIGCHIADAGATAVSFVGDPEAVRSPLFEYHQTQTLDEMDKTPGPKTPDFPADCLVENCLIHGNGRVEKQTAGVNICIAEQITVRHCSVYDCPRAGINICAGAFGGHLIEFCDVFDTVNETGDHGSFNSWGRDRFWHPNRDVTAQWVKQHPTMSTWECGKTVILRNNRWRCDHGWDIDLDDGSSNYEIYNNLCLAGGIKLREGYYRKVYNNVLVDWTFCPHVWYPNCHTSFLQNIIGQERYRPAGMQKTDQRERIDYNLVHQPGGESRPAEALRSFGGDQHSLIADAMFVNSSLGDYRVGQDSPAVQLGFRNFPMDRFGVQLPELKQLAKTPPLPGTLAATTVRSGGWDRRYDTPTRARWFGAQLKTIEDEGEMSAVGRSDRNGVLVVDVPDGSRASEAGLRANDVILAVNGQPIANLQAFAAWHEKTTGGGPITLSLWRDQAEISLTVPIR